MLAAFRLPGWEKPMWHRVFNDPGRFVLPGVLIGTAMLVALEWA
jgi:hypothetical protein